MPNVHFDFRRGAGSAPEILFGTVSIKATSYFQRGTSLVLPAPTTLDLVDGEATATNVAPSPAPVDGQVEWAYVVTAKDRHGKSFEWIVGVPFDTGTVEFASLPRYFETKPPLFGQGPQGVPGEAATIEIGSVTSGETPNITNSGTANDAVLDFVLPKGDKGDPGNGVPAGGSALQVIRKNSDNTSTEWVTPTKALVGLSNVDNTSDANKPVSTPQQTAINNYGQLAIRSKSMTDAPSTYPGGTSVFIGDIAQGWPQPSTIAGQATLQVTTIKTSTRLGGTIQWLSAFSNTSAPLMYRTADSADSWGEFATIMDTRSAKNTNVFEGDEGVVHAHKYATDGTVMGDGSNNDYWPIQRAINAGKEVLLEGGKTYLIAGTLSMPANGRNNVSIRATGSEPAILKIGASGQSYGAINFRRSDTPDVEKTLVVSTGINFKYWQVADATGVEPGMLCMVVSSALWYHDPRPGIGEARKSELHRVSHVQGTRIYMEDGANDGYDVNTETVALYFYKPIKVRLENITVQGTLPAVAEETNAVEGIVIDKADTPILIDVNVDSCARTGIRVSKSYRPIVSRGETSKSNNYWNGYGVSIAGCAYGVVQDRHIRHSRRAVDVSSSQIEEGSTKGSIISRQTVIERCKAIGGGSNSRGTTYGWEQDGTAGAYQGGFGSHGGADTVIYRNNEVYDMHAAFTVRGRTSIIHDNLIVGRSTGGAIQATHGGTHLYIYNNRAIAGYWSLKPYNSFIPSGPSINSNQIDTLLTIYATWGGNPPVGTQRGQVVVTGNEVECRAALVRFHQMPFGETYIANNRIRISPVVSSTDVSMLDNRSGVNLTPAQLSRWYIGPNVMSKSPAHTGTLTEANFPLTGANVLNYTVSS